LGGDSSEVLIFVLSASKIDSFAAGKFGPTTGVPEHYSGRQEI